jgi:hypothetical protein
MTPDERERFMRLCEKIAREEDPTRFAELTLELSYFLERNRDELKRNEPPAYAGPPNS